MEIYALPRYWARSIAQPKWTRRRADGPAEQLPGIDLVNVREGAQLNARLVVEVAPAGFGRAMENRFRYHSKMLVSRYHAENNL